MNLMVRKSLMNCIPYIFSAALFPQNSHCMMWSSLSGFSSTSWRGFSRGSSKVCKLDFVLTGFHFHCFSTHRSRTRPLPMEDSQPSMVEESNAFYVVRKGDIVGIYKSLSDCQAQVSVSVCHIYNYFWLTLCYFSSLIYQLTNHIMTKIFILTYIQTWSYTRNFMLYKSSDEIDWLVFWRTSMPAELLSI